VEACDKRLGRGKGFKKKKHGNPGRKSATQANLAGHKPERQVRGGMPGGSKREGFKASLSSKNRDWGIVRSGGWPKPGSHHGGNGKLKGKTLAAGKLLLGLLRESLPRSTRRERDNKKYPRKRIGV